MNNNIINLTEKNFEKFIFQTKIPVLVDFWADWCGPCKMFAPILEDISKEYEGNLVVAKVNVSNDPKIVAQYSVSSIPTVLLFNKNQLIATSTGMLSKLEIKKFLNKHINDLE